MRYKKNIVVLDETLPKVDRNDRSRIPRSMRQRGAAIRMGGLAAALIAVIWAINGILSVISSVAERPGRSVPASAVDVESAEYNERNPLTVLMIKKTDMNAETRTDDIEFCALIRFDPINERVAVAPIPADLLVGETTLRQEYAAGGEWQCASSLAKYLEAWEISYTSVDFDEASALINKFGGVRFNLTHEVNYEYPSESKNERKKRSIHIPPQSRVFDGSEIARMLDWPDWPGGDEDRSLTYAKVWATLINDNLTPGNKSRLADLYGRVANNSKTNVAMSDIQHAEQGLRHLCELNENRDIAKMPMNVTAAKQDGVYVYDDVSLANMRAVFCR
ncbi:MAG: hypothetical protein FWE86_04660 [Oscillospiraceae bacterium]|nr:hypothetical protein [Oscillospiraceae bacterium]